MQNPAQILDRQSPEPQNNRSELLFQAKDRHDNFLIKEVRDGLAEADLGEFATDKDMNAIFAKYTN